VRKPGVHALAVALAFTSCSHRQPSSQAQAESGQAPVQDEAAANNLPQPATIYPRAQLVALPGTPLPPPAAPATASPAVEASDVTATNIPPSSTPPAESMPAATPPTQAAPEVAAATNAAPDPTAMAPLAPATDIPLTAPPPPPLDTSDDSIQVVVLQTTFGRIVIQLDDFAAPKTCANFRNLVSSGFYNGTIFHRVIPHFIIQGGDPNSKTDNRATYGQGDPGYTLPPEIKLSHDRGAVAMARLPDAVNPARDSNGSQFYICVEACPSLDDQYTVFAHVIEGMAVVERISNVPRDSRDDPLVRIVMDARLESKSQARQETATAGH